ncbi:MAG: prenyltransferase/squalene oxidase repeat-containing protein [Isosphaeraceae bacterium]
MSTNRPATDSESEPRDRWSELVNADLDADTLRSVPSWGLSLLLHALLLLLLAFVIHFRSATQRPERLIQPAVVDSQLGEVTSLTPASRSGDPFTIEDNANPPSLGLTPADPLLKLVGEPQIAALTQYAPVLGAPNLLSKTDAGPGALSTVMRLPELATSVSAPFSGRQGLSRAQLVRREGGTARSEKSVEDGISWIVRHQRPDGSWSLNYQQQCQGDGCPHRLSMESDTAATGLALLPLLGSGYIHTVKSRHQAAVRRGLEWLVKHQQPDGDLYTGPPGMGYLYSHAIGTMALCEAYGLSQDPKLKRPAQRAVQFIVNCQDPTGGGWRYTPGQAGDTSVFGWQIFALRSGNIAGIKISPKILKSCTLYLDQAAADESRVTYSYQPGRPATAVMTAEALVCRQILGWPRDFPPLVKGASQVAIHLDLMDERNIYYWYYATQLLHNMKDKDWESWNPRVREALIEMQVKDDSCAKGSWDPFQPVPDHWAQRAGRLYLTSLSILTLEVYYRYLPLYRDYDEEQAKAGGPSGRAAQKKSG